MPDVRWAVELEGADVDVDVFAGVVNEMRTILEDIEQNLTSAAPKAVWHMEDAAVLRAVASPNGVPEATLRQIVELTREGFERLAQAQGHLGEWVPGLSSRGRHAFLEVARYLSRIDSLTLEVEGREPLTVEGADIAGAADAAGRTRPEYSSLDGKLDLISVRSRPLFVIEEHGSGRRVRCRFADELIDRVKEALGRRVVVEGLIRYSWDGQPTSMSGITSLFVRPEPTVDLSDLVGAAPGFTGGEDPVEYVRAMRDDPDA
jgi:hypothetical protein